MTSPVAAHADNADPAAQTTEFFDALFGYAPDNLTALLWTLQDKRSTWRPLDAGPQAVADKARDLADRGNDVYVAVSVADPAAAGVGRPDARIKSSNSAGLMGLWADIDIADPDVHKKWNLPPTVDAALELLDATELEPTMIVHSGHGLQAWWLFKEFWEFDTEEARLEAAGLAQRWNTTLQVHAAKREWVVDSTFDLARVMRVPGTMNRKGDPVVPVWMLTSGGPRYTPDDIDARLVDETLLAGRGLTVAKRYKPDEITVGPARKVNFEKLQALIDNNDGFGATWDMKRTQRDFPDQSPSSYEMALANFAARAEWSDQEIGDLFKSFRERHKLDMSKAYRADYVSRTIARARESIMREEANEALDDLGEAYQEAVLSGDPDAQRETRRHVMDAVSSQLEVEITHLVKYMSEPPSYAAVTPIKEIPLGGIDGITNWHKCRDSLGAGLNTLIRRFKPGDWDRICDQMLHVVVELDVGSEATERGELSSWLSGYLSQRPPVDTLEEAATSEYPYVDDGRVVMFGPAFKRWLYLTYQEKITNKDLGRRLRAFGCEPDKVNVNDTSGKRTTRAIWRLPVGVGKGD